MYHTVHRKADTSNAVAAAPVLVDTLTLTHPTTEGHTLPCRPVPQVLAVKAIQGAVTLMWQEMNTDIHTGSPKGAYRLNVSLKLDL